MLAFPYFLLNAAIYTLPRGYRRQHTRHRYSRYYVHRSRFTLLKPYHPRARSSARRPHTRSSPRPSPTLPTSCSRTSKSSRRFTQRLRNITRRRSVHLRSRGRNSPFAFTARANDSGLTPDDSRGIHDVSTDLHFFDCYDYYDSLTNLYLNRFRETCSEVYYDSPSSTPTSNSTVRHLTLKEYVSTAIDSIDVLTHQRSISAVLHNMPITYRRLCDTEPEYHTILLQARSLQARIFHYDQQFTSPLSNPMIYLSANTDELPIIIDTGASCSLTPIPSDFDGRLTKPDITGLAQVSGEATVAGAGTVTWNIEDLRGIRRPITTKAYYVPSASIRLFSPQSYIGDSDKAALLLITTYIAHIRQDQPRCPFLRHPQIACLA